jgi:hypothetical protein
MPVDGVTVVVEGPSDLGAAEKLLVSCGLKVGRPIVCRGSAKLDAKLASYARAAERSPWLILRDTDGKCPVELAARLLPPDSRGRLLSFRLAHAEIESWLLADVEACADYFGVPLKVVPRLEDGQNGAKEALLKMCRRSRQREIRAVVRDDDLVAQPLYVPVLQRFARERWRPDTAAERSDSLRRALLAIRGLQKRRLWPAA